jgi:tetratricopeptide (TPR) repeat protein
MTNSSQMGAVLTTEERLARRKLILHDAIALLTLFLITAVLFALTLLLYRSFTDHEQELGLRWKARGEAALRAGDPKSAINSLRSALAYVPARDTEIELATALAGAGRTTEATAYFNTLREEAPGDAVINLQLARLAARQGDEAVAILRYQAALDGTWQGNGFNRRRQVRLEMAGYLTSRHHLDEARTQLLIAASNAPDDPQIKLQIAGMLEQAQDLPGALSIYRSLAARRPAPIGALAGAGRAAFTLGMYRVAAEYLNRELADPEVSSVAATQITADREMLNNSLHILDLYPAFDLPARVRAERVLAARKTGRARLTACAASPAAAPEPLAPIVTRWAQVPARLPVAELEQQPDLEQSILQLVYDTETVTAQVCGSPTGDDALLLRIARNPGAVEQE